MQIGFSFSHFFYDLSFIMEFENISSLKLTNTTNIYFYFVWEKKEQTLNEKEKKVNKGKWWLLLDTKTVVSKCVHN